MRERNTSFAILQEEENFFSCVSRGVMVLKGHETGKNSRGVRTR